MKIHSFESLAAVDGEGLRYGVFLAGCPLRCVYCHNPDTWQAGGAQELSPEELCRKIKRYKPYFKAGRGGVTFSGGEPLLQAGELLKLCDLLGREGIGYAVDTSGHVDLTDEVRRLIRGADLILLDLKFASDGDYKKYTGGRLSTVESTLAYACEVGARVRIRTVILPGINDSEAALDEYIKRLKPYMSCIVGYELLGFHTMGFAKYEVLGIENPMRGAKPLDRDLLCKLQAYVDSRL